MHIAGVPSAGQVWIEDGEKHSLRGQLTGRQLVVTVNGFRHDYLVADDDHQIWLYGDGRTVLVEEVREAPVRGGDEHSGDAELASPMPGSVVAVGVQNGARVAAGDLVVAVEAMKMEHSLRSPVAGRVELLASLGDQVTRGQVLARIISTEGGEQ